MYPNYYKNSIESFTFTVLLLDFLKNILFLFFINEKTKGFHMRYHSFLHYGWFLQNLGKDFIPTNMHTTVQQHSTVLNHLYSDFQRIFKTSSFSNSNPRIKLGFFAVHCCKLAKQRLGAHQATRQFKTATVFFQPQEE